MKLFTIVVAFLLASCSQPFGDKPAEAPVLEANILIVIDRPDGETWLRNDFPDRLRGNILIDEQSHSRVDASISIDRNAIRQVELLSVLKHTSIQPIFCGGHMDAGSIVDSICFVGPPSHPTWLEVNGKIVAGEGYELARGRIFCTSMIGDGRTSNAACEKFDYLQL